MKSTNAIVLAGLVLLIILPAKANLILGSDPTFGPNSLLIDTQTQLAWLNLTESAGLSYNQALADTQSGGLFSGYRFATEQDILSLWGDAGFTPGEYALANSASIESFVSLMGNTDPTDGYPGLVANSGTGVPGIQVSPAIYTYYDNGNLVYLVATRNTAGYGDTTSYPTLANWLVKTVPEPGAYAIAITGLVALVFIRRFPPRASVPLR